MRAVACPVALHPDGAPLRVSAFEHPQAGLQLVKGGIKDGEGPERAAARELFEESGLETCAAILLGHSTDIHPGEDWHFVLCRLVPPVRAAWQHLRADDGEHVFRFFWHPLDETTPDGFNLRYQNALKWIANSLES